MRISNLVKSLAFMALVVVASPALANPIFGNTCGVPDRVATLTDADMCAFGPSNPDADTIAGYYGDVWGDVGELTSDGTDGYLTATSDAGWGNIPNSGTWAIDSGFWTLYSRAVITMHIGNGGGDPDHWAWLLDANALSGTWSLDYSYAPNTSTKGGGLSNIRLWGVSGGYVIPEPAPLALLGLGILGLMLARRRKA